MKTIIIPSLTLLIVIVCSGCRQSDSAKIDDLTLKVDALMLNQVTICSNQAVVLNQLQALKTGVAALPDMVQVDAMAHFYHTNEMNRLNAMWNWESAVATNQLAATAASSSHADPASMNEIMLELKTGDMAHDVFMINARTTDMTTDLIKIKSKLGIPY
jgi:hypothetical protein